MGSLGRTTRWARLVDWSPEQMRFLNFGRVIDTQVLREEFGYTPRYTTSAALADYARTVEPVVAPATVRSVAEGLRAVLSHVSDTATAVERRLRPVPPPPGLRAVRDA